jgi:hypothetical protein
MILSRSPPATVSTAAPDGSPLIAVLTAMPVATLAVFLKYVHQDSVCRQNTPHTTQSRRGICFQYGSRAYAQKKEVFSGFRKIFFPDGSSVYDTIRRTASHNI